LQTVPFADITELVALFLQFLLACREELAFSILACTIERFGRREALSLHDDRHGVPTRFVPAGLTGSHLLGSSDMDDTALAYGTFISTN
jgi:hypothetical protein